MIKRIFFILILVHSTVLLSQNYDSIPEGKSVVYFVRASGLGALINFTYFDGEKVIGRFNGPKYMKYVCDSGKHLFWARSENKSFVEAELRAGEIYVIDVLPQMGGIKAGVKLVPVDKSIYKMKKIQKLVSKREPEAFDDSKLAELQDEMKEVIEHGMEKYNNLQEKGKEVLQLEPDMIVSENDLVYVKKKSN